MADVEFELNVFGEEPRCHLKLTGQGTPPLEFIVSAFKRVQDAQDLWGQTEGAAETPQDEAEAPSKPAPKPRGGLSRGRAIKDPDAPASGKQKGMILGLCESIDDDQGVIDALNHLGELDGTIDGDGRYIPGWDFLNELTMQQASNAITALKKLE